MVEGSLVSTYVQKMTGFIENLTQLGSIMDHKLSIDLVLQSLPESYLQFIMNLNMNKLKCTLLIVIPILKYSFDNHLINMEVINGC